MPDVEENNPEAREEPVEMIAARSMRFAPKGQRCSNIKTGETFITERKNVRWLEHSRKAFRDKKKAARIAGEIEAEFVGHIQQPEGGPAPAAA